MINASVYSSAKATISIAGIGSGSANLKIYADSVGGYTDQSNQAPALFGLQYVSGSAQDSLNAPELTDHKFLGWFTTRNNVTYGNFPTMSNADVLLTSNSSIKTSEITAGAKTTSWPAIGDVYVLYAKYEQTYTVTFVDHDGTVLKTQSGISSGGSATPPANPTRDGWTFASWSGSYTNVTSNRTITATYTATTYTVTVNPNGGTGGSCPGYSTSTSSQTKNVTLPTLTGNHITSWTIAGASGGTPSVSGTTLTIPRNTYGNLTLTPNWMADTYTVDLRTNGGAIVRGNISSYQYGDGATLPTEVTRAGFAFAGWYANSDFTGDRVYVIAPEATGNKIFYANWTSEFTVTFKGHDGNVLKVETVPTGGDATPPEHPTREGYVPDGWDGSYTNVTSDRTLTAQYTVLKLTVTFKGLNGTVIGSPQEVDYGSAATAPTPPEPEGYTFVEWDRDFSRVTESMTVNAVYSGASNYTIRGRRWQRLYTAAKATPVYSAESEASLAARTICDVPWTMTSGNFVPCLTAHAGTAEADTHNLESREYFDAAAFCAGHENGMHRVYAQATCYRFALPQTAAGKRMNTIALTVSGDPYLRDGARIAVLTNSTGIIPTDCTTCRTGNVHKEGVAKRTVSADGTRWYGKTERVVLTPSGGLTLGSFLYVFVILENYAYSRSEYIEGSACIQPNVEIGLSGPVTGWTTDGENLCYEDMSHEYAVCRGGVLAESVGDVSGVQTIRVQRSGDPLTGTLHTTVTDEQSCFGLRSVYAALYERRLAAVAKSVALVGNAKAGAGFVVRGDQVSVGGTNVKTWQLTTAALLVPFAVPTAFRANKISLSWPAITSTAGGRFNVWLKRGAYITEYPADALKNPALYDATVKDAEGYELLGTIDAQQASRTASFTLEDPLGGYVATILLTAFISLDNLNPSSGMTLPQGVSTAMNVKDTTAEGMSTGWKPDITLIG